MKIGDRKYVLSIIILIPIILILKMFYFDIYKVTSNSMANTFVKNNFVLTRKIYNSNQYYFNKSIELKRFDVVVFKSVINDDRVLLKRIIGLPGDEFELKESKLKINNKSINFCNYKFKTQPSIKVLSPFVNHQNWDKENYGPIYIPKKEEIFIIDSSNVDIYSNILLKNEKLNLANKKLPFEHKFKTNYYFLLGDNFYNSIDSRFFGFVPEQMIIGKVLF